MDFKSIVLAIVFFAAMVGIYIFLYKANKKTPLPPGCENVKQDCGGCKDTSCSNNPGYRFK